jgi:hypothetical protein
MNWDPDWASYSREWVCVTTQSLSLADGARTQTHRIIYFFISNRSVIPVIKAAFNEQLVLRWRTRALEHLPVRVAGSELLGAASDIDLDATQILYVTYSATEIRTFQWKQNAALGARSEHAHRYPMQDDWIDL